MKLRVFWIVGSVLLGALQGVGAAKEARHSYILTFDQPMSWADDISPRGLSEVQNWEIADGGNPGKALRISAAVYQQPTSFEIRTLHFNHRPNTEVSVRLDVKAVCAPPNSRMTIRHFDGYCGAFPFVKCEEDDWLAKSFPAPLWDSRSATLTGDWQNLKLDLGTLRNTVVTLAFIVEQPKAIEGQYIEYLLDNLKVDVSPLISLMDPHFEWHGNPGRNTVEFRFNTACADADWCDFAEQTIAKNWQDKDIRFTLMHFRDSSTKIDPGIGYQIMHQPFSEDVGGASVIAMSKYQSNCAASWGVRQTISYKAVGLKPEDEARIRVTMKATNVDTGNQQMTRVQVGAGPQGGIVTEDAVWSWENYAIHDEDGWQYVHVDFDKPKGVEAFTVYFRHRDGRPAGREQIDPHEPQSSGTAAFARGFADWVMLEVLDEDEEQAQKGRL